MRSHLSERTIVIPEASASAQESELRRKKLLSAKSAFICGDETMDEIAARFQLSTRDLGKVSKKQCWIQKRSEHRKQQEERAILSESNRIGDMQRSFVSDANAMLKRLSGLIHTELERIEAGEKDALKNKPTAADTHRIAKTIETFVEAGKKVLGMEIVEEELQEIDSKVIDVENLEPIEPPQLEERTVCQE